MRAFAQDGALQLDLGWLMFQIQYGGELAAEGALAAGRNVYLNDVEAKVIEEIILSLITDPMAIPLRFYGVPSDIEMMFRSYYQDGGKEADDLILKFPNQLFLWKRLLEGHHQYYSVSCVEALTGYPAEYYDHIYHIHQPSATANYRMENLSYILFIWGFEARMQQFVMHAENSLPLRNPVLDQWLVKDTRKPLMNVQEVRIRRTFAIAEILAHMLAMMGSMSGDPNADFYGIWEEICGAIEKHVVTRAICYSDGRMSDELSKLLFGELNSRRRRPRMNYEDEGVRQLAFGVDMDHPMLSRLMAVGRWVFGYETLNAGEWIAKWGDFDTQTNSELIVGRQAMLGEIQSALEMIKEIGWIGQFYELDGRLKFDLAITPQPFWEERHQDDGRFLYNFALLKAADLIEHLGILTESKELRILKTLVNLMLM